MVMSLKAFVTGATGFVGSNLVKELHHQGWDITILARPTSSLSDIADVPDITSMGTPKAPIHLLHWMARKNALRAVVAQGIGSSMEGADVAQSVKAGWTQGRWSVVFTRSLIAGKQAVSLVPGTQSQIGFAVWDGSNEERAGIKAVSADWTDFQIKE